MSETKRDVIIIGAGPGGYVCAIRLAQLGKRVTLIEKEALGGVCLNWGCIPSKALIHAAGLFEKMQNAAEMGITVSKASIDFSKLISWKDGIVGKLTGGIKVLLQKHGVEIIMGEAKFTSSNAITVKSNDGKELAIEAEHFVIATGSSIVDLPQVKADHSIIIDSTDALALDKLPASMVIIGGGIIGMELGMVYHKLGTQITVIELADQLLLGTDKEITDAFQREMKKRKIPFHLNSLVTSCEKSASGAKLTVKNPKETLELETEIVLVCVGRKPNTTGIGLTNAKVKTTERGFIPVDNQLRTNQKHIFAIGDVTGTPYLAHKASKEGLVVADVIAGKATEYDVRALPSAIFTTPEIATVGLNEADALAQNRAVKIGKFPFGASGKALAMNEGTGFVKVVADAETDELLGVQMIGPDVSELIAEAALAIEMGATAADLALTVHAHPTLPESLMEAAEAVHDMAVHVYMAPSK